MQTIRLGWQQKEILKRINEYPGLSTSAITKGLKRTNRPERSLEQHGFIENHPEGNTNCWFITKKGREKLESYAVFN